MGIRNETRVYPTNLQYGLIIIECMEVDFSANKNKLEFRRGRLYLFTIATNKNGHFYIVILSFLFTDTYRMKKKILLVFIVFGINILWFSQPNRMRFVAFHSPCQNARWKTQIRSMHEKNHEANAYIKYSLCTILGLTHQFAKCHQFEIFLIEQVVDQSLAFCMSEFYRHHPLSHSYVVYMNKIE